MKTSSSPRSARRGTRSGEAGRSLKIVLDTHVWLWWVALEDRLSSEAASAIAEAETIAISAISAWEVAMLSAKGRIRLDRAAPDWIRLALSRPGVSAVPVDPPIAVAAAGLGQAGVPADQADRMIYATSRSLGAVLVTKDQALRDFDPHGTLW